LKLKDLAKKINAEVIGDKDKVISCISSIDNPSENTLVYVSSEKHVNKLSDLKVVFLAGIELELFLKHKNALIVSDPKKAFANVLEIFSSFKSDLSLDSEPFYKGKNVVIGSTPIFGLNVILEDNVVIGDNVFLSHNVVIKKNVKIGNNVSIDSGTVIGSEGFGNFRDSNDIWHHYHHIGSVKIGNNVSIGSNCSIDRGTIDSTEIGNGVIIDNLVHIAHNVVIGENTAIAAKVGIAGSCNIGKRNMIGGMVGIVDHINTVDDVIISATSTVNQDIKESGIYTGIMPISKHVTWKRIALWITKLDKIAKLVNLRKK